MSPTATCSKALLIAACFSAIASSVVAAPSHHIAHRPRPRPAGVPEGYVFTHSGFFHPSCVYTLLDDEVWTPGSIKARDGAVRERVTPCVYPHFSNDGRAVTGRPRAAHTGGGSGADLSGPFGDFDGWLLYALGGEYTSHSVPQGATLSSTWTVPGIPTDVLYQDLAFFNGFELDAGHADDMIVQPVLDFSEVAGHWAIESEECCFEGNDIQTSLAVVNPGDTIRGVIVPSNCDASTKVCTDIAITTADLTSGASRTLNASAHNLVVNAVDGAVFETYSVTSCDMLPQSGEVVFDGALTDTSGQTVPMTYDTGNCVTGSCFVDNGNLTNVPTSCGWDATQSAGTFTLTFGQAPTVLDGGGVLFDDAGVTSQVDAAVEKVPADAAVAVPDDMAVAPKAKKHGCSMAPLGSAPAPTSSITLFVIAIGLVLLRGRSKTR